MSVLSALLMAGQALAQDVDVTVQTLEGCVGIIGESLARVESAKAIAFGRCKSGKLDGYAVVLTRLTAEDVLTPAKFEEGVLSMYLLEALTVQADGRSSFKRHFGGIGERVFNFPTAATALEEWKRVLQEIPDFADHMRVPRDWDDVRILLDRHGRPYVRGEVPPGSVAANITGEFWPQGWQAVSQSTAAIAHTAKPKAPLGWVFVKAGNCKVPLHERYDREHRYVWDGRCEEGHAVGSGILRMHDGSGKLLVIGRVEVTYGKGSPTKLLESYSLGGSKIFRTVGESAPRPVTPSEVPSWAQEIVSSRAPGPGSVSDRSRGGTPLRGIVGFVISSEGYGFHAPNGVSIYAPVAGRGESEIRKNADALASAFRGRSVRLTGTCNGPGFVLGARITHTKPQHSAGYYAGCFDAVDVRTIELVRRWESEAVGDAVNWYYVYFVVGYVDDRNFRGRDQWSSSLQEGGGFDGAPSSMVLDNRYWSTCDTLKYLDEQRDMPGCLREAVGKLKSRLGLR